MDETTARSAASPPSPPAPEYVAGLHDTLAERLSARDRDGVVRTGLDAVRVGGISVADLYTLVLGPLMVETGDRWQQGRTRVWEEHFTTQSVRSLVESLAPEVMTTASSVSPAGARVLMACPPGEQHDLGLRMLADRFRLAGYDVYYLGTDTPVDEIVDACRALAIDLLVLSASTHYNLVLLRDVAARIRTAVPNVRLGVGGPAFCRDKQWPHDEMLDPVALGLPGARPADATPAKPSAPAPGEGAI